MKKLRLNLQEFENSDILSRDELRSIQGGSGGTQSCFESCGTWPTMGASCIGLISCSYAIDNSTGAKDWIACDGQYYDC